MRYNSYTRTEGSPVHALAAGAQQARAQLPEGVRIGAVGTTGSGRFLAGAFLGADVVKNEITAHAVGTLHWRPDIATIIEIGGQDSKIVHLRDGMVRDFAMNTVCAAGTGAFLDQQAFRLKIPSFRISQSGCPHCRNQCRIYSLNGEQGVLARWGGRCDRGNAP